MSVRLELVKAYAHDEGLFFGQFAKSMVKMGNISLVLSSVLTEKLGRIVVGLTDEVIN